MLAVIHHQKSNAPTPCVTNSGTNRAIASRSTPRVDFAG